MHPFEEYLKKQNLEALTVSIKAGVRYMAVYNAMKGLPITPENARRIRLALWEITGVVYNSTLTLTEPELVEDAPTIPIKKISRHNFI